jgi:hypothetical protein
MVREARFLGSDPFENSADPMEDDWDDLDLLPLRRRRDRAAKSRRQVPSQRSPKPADGNWPLTPSPSSTSVVGPED